MDYMTMNFNRNGGGGGTSDYSQLKNKPSINDVTLSGNKTASDLGLMDHYDIDEAPTEDSDNLITSGAVWTADKGIKDRLQGSKTAGSTDGSPFEIPDYGMTESIQMYFKPTQDLHGYDKPWAGGAGKNKCPAYTSTDTQYGVTITGNSKGEISVSGTLDGTNLYGFVLNSSISLGAGTYTLNGANPNGARLVLYDSNDNVLADTQDANPTFTLESTTTAVLRMFVYANVQYDEVVRPMIRLSTETDDTFEPYSNICPISGQNNATFEWTDSHDIENEVTMNFGNTYYGGFCQFNGSIYPDWDYISGSSISDLQTWATSAGVTFRTSTTDDGNLRVEFAEIAEPVSLDTDVPSYNMLRCNELNNVSDSSMYWEPISGVTIQNDGDVRFAVNGIATQADMDTWLSNNPIQIAYKKKTPSYVRVTPPANLNLTDDYPIEYNGYMANISYQPKNTVLAEAKQYTNQEIAKLGFPQPPTTDGTYHLECSVSGGIPTIRWVLNS